MELMGDFRQVQAVHARQPRAGVPGNAIENSVKLAAREQAPLAIERESRDVGLAGLVIEVSLACSSHAMRSPGRLACGDI